MRETEKRTIAPNVSEKLSVEVAYQAKELLSRLKSGQFNLRKENSTRRADGEATLEESPLSNTLHIRLNAFGASMSAVVALEIGEDGVTARSVQIRTREMGGDDRGQIAIPQALTPENLKIVENLVFGACACVGRGAVKITQTDPTRKSFQLFLPSQNPLPTFNEHFELIGLRSQY